MKRKPDKTSLIQFQLFFFFRYKPACLQKNFHGRLLSIRVFSADGHYLNNRVFLSKNCWSDSCPAEIWKPRVKLEKENRQKPLNTISIACFLQTRLFTKKFSLRDTIYPGIFRGWALSIRAFSMDRHYGLIVAHRGWTLSRDQFKPIRIGENLVVNYNGW